MYYLFRLNLEIVSYYFFDFLEYILTLRRDRGGGVYPPLEKNLRLLKNGAPKARHFLDQLLKF